jgi:hypothetical protein
MLALLALIAGLLIMGRLLARMSDGHVLISWVLLWLPLLALLFWRRRIARRAWLRVHLQEGSPWSARLRGGVLMLLSQTLVSGALALALLIPLARGIPASTWIVLVLFVPVWAKAWSGLGRAQSRLTVGRTAPAPPRVGQFSALCGHPVSSQERTVLTRPLVI